MAHITIDTQADSDDNYIYVIKDGIGLEISFDCEWREEGERGEIWGGHVAIEGDSWIEVDSVSNLQITRVYDPETDEDLATDSAVIGEADKPVITELIKEVVCEYIQPTKKPAYDRYFA
nr:hypothetical protein [uncultured Psychrobacter sp.]